MNSSQLKTITPKRTVYVSHPSTIFRGSHKTIEATQNTNHQPLFLASKHLSYLKHPVWHQTWEGTRPVPSNGVVFSPTWNPNHPRIQMVGWLLICWWTKSLPWKKACFNHPFPSMKKTVVWGSKVMYTLPETMWVSGNLSPRHGSRIHQERGDLGAARALGKSGESTSARFWAFKGNGFGKRLGPGGWVEISVYYKMRSTIRSYKKQLLVANMSLRCFETIFVHIFEIFVVRTPLW